MTRLQFVEPQLASLVDAAPEGDEWVFEIKYDGYRLEVAIQSGKATMLTRRGNDWTERFADLAGHLSRIKARSALLDGEVVVLDRSGKSSFALLQQSLDAHRTVDLTYFAFDLLQLDGKDLRALPLHERRKQLEKLLRASRMVDKGPVRLGQRLDGEGSVLLAAACDLGLEGIIAKRNDAAYTSGRSPVWRKIKCGRRQEFVVIGYTAPQGSRVGIGSLLLAVYQKGKLQYAGRVGTGMDDAMLAGLATRLKKLARKTSPLGVRPAGVPSSVTWIEPRMVVEVAFTEWTSEGNLRHPVFQGIREDKPATEIRREEIPMAPTKARAGARPTAPATRTSKPRVAAQPAPHRTHSAASDTVAGVTITHPDRVVFPEPGITKLELGQHFERVAPLMLPHVAGRPLSLVRCPEGAQHECFFQKHWTGKQPASIDTVGIKQSDGKKHPHVVIHDVTGLVTLVQWGVIEIHPWGSRADDPERPDRIIFDLDPGPGVTWPAIKEATRGVHALLDALGLESWLKTSGGKGLHVVVPIARRSSWDEVSDFARAVAEHMQAEFPDRFISKSSKAAREGLIFVDWLRNTRGATAVAPWSTRARPAAGVSTPVPWSRLGALTSGDQFTVRSLAKRLPKDDAWATIASTRQAITRGMMKRLGVS